jgi:hypothetical protein
MKSVPADLPTIISVQIIGQIVRRFVVNVRTSKIAIMSGGGVEVQSTVHMHEGGTV